jgi:hypothetical protein
MFLFAARQREDEFRRMPHRGRYCELISTSLSSTPRWSAATLDAVVVEKLGSPMLVHGPAVLFFLK